jgi:hypothetical protein
MDFHTNNYDQLVCPNCLGLCLHHSSIDVFERREDDPEHMQIHIDRSEVKISKGTHGNPSPRRDGLSILFWCEGCTNFPKLNIFQHKGSTYIQWGSK